MNNDEEENTHLPHHTRQRLTLSQPRTPPELLFPSEQASVHQQKPLYSQQCCFYSRYIYPQSCPSGTAGTADLKQSLTLMTGG